MFVNNVLCQRNGRESNLPAISHALTITPPGHTLLCGHYHHHHRVACPRMNVAMPVDGQCSRRPAGEKNTGCDVPGSLLDKRRYL